MKTINEENYVNKAEEAIQSLTEEAKRQQGRGGALVTTSKIRNLLAMTSDIYNQVLLCQTEKLDSELVGRIEYLRVRFMYECGREKTVKKFVEVTELLEILKEVGGSRKNYLLFSRYMEALIAFHRYYGGQD